MRDQSGRLVKQGDVLLQILTTHYGVECGECFVAKLTDFNSTDWEIVLQGIHKNIYKIVRGCGRDVTSEKGVRLYKMATSLQQYEEQRL